MAQELVGADVIVSIDEPFELIAERPLVVRGKVSGIGGTDHPSLTITLNTTDARLAHARLVTAAARHTGDSVLTLAPGGSMLVHGNFFTEGKGEILQGYIGRLEVEREHP